MILNVIYDSRRGEKYDLLISELESNKVDYKIWEAEVQKESVVSSINASHKNIVRWAKENNLKEVAIAEDDIWFTCDESWEYFLDNKPSEYDLYLASTYVPPISNNVICGFHLYLVHSDFYDTFLSVPDNEHIDTVFNNMNGNYKFCYPFVALQRSGWSSNNKCVVNYNSLITDKDLYK